MLQDAHKLPFCLTLQLVSIEPRSPQGTTWCIDVSVCVPLCCTVLFCVLLFFSLCCTVSVCSALCCTKLLRLTLFVLLFDLGVN